MIKSRITDTKTPVYAWIETEQLEAMAIEQIRNVANLPFIFKHLAIMPDAHAGYGATIGSVIATKDCVIPSAVGVDIGCGMLAFPLPYSMMKVLAHLKDLVHTIERAIPTGFHWHKEPKQKAIQFFDTLTPPAALDKPLVEKAILQCGTLGGGNHFIEISADQHNNTWVVIHTGSRNAGLKIANHHIGIAKTLMKAFHIELADQYLAYLPTDSQEGIQYLKDTNWAQNYAKLNRSIIAHTIAKEIERILGEPEPTEITMIECCHNYISRELHYGETVFVTRKGAISADRGEMVIIPGSMGTTTHIARGLGEAASFHSASHGAGRIMSRSEAKKTITKEMLAEQMKGILYDDKKNLLDEAPSAYKDIATVMANQDDLVSSIYQLRQLASIKGADE